MLSIKKLLSNTTQNQSGIAHLGLIAFLLIAIGVGTYLVQTNTDIFPSADEPESFTCNSKESAVNDCDKRQAPCQKELNGNKCTGVRYAKYLSCEDGDGDGECDSFSYTWTQCSEPYSACEGDQPPPQQQPQQQQQQQQQGNSSSNQQNNPANNDRNSCSDENVPTGSSVPAGYKWVPFCNISCSDTDEHTDCPVSDSGFVDQKTSRWCFPFKEGNRCLKLYPEDDKEVSSQERKNQNQQANSTGQTTTQSPTGNTGIPTKTQDLQQVNEFENKFKTEVQNKGGTQTGLIKEAEDKTTETFAKAKEELNKCAETDKSCIDQAHKVFDLAKVRARMTAYYKVVSNVPNVCAKMDFGLDPLILSEPLNGGSNERVYLCNGANGTDKKWRWFDNDNKPGEFKDQTKWKPNATYNDYPVEVKNHIKDGVTLAFDGSANHLTFSSSSNPLNSSSSSSSTTPGALNAACSPTSACQTGLVCDAGKCTDSCTGKATTYCPGKKGTGSTCESTGICKDVNLVQTRQKADVNKCSPRCSGDKPQCYQVKRGTVARFECDKANLPVDNDD